MANRNQIEDVLNAIFSRPETVVELLMVDGRRYVHINDPNHPDCPVGLGDGDTWHAAFADAHESALTEYKAKEEAKAKADALSEALDAWEAFVTGEPQLTGPAALARIARHRERFKLQKAPPKRPTANSSGTTADG